MRSASRSRFPWPAVIAAILTVGLLWLFFRTVDVREAWQAMLRSNLWLVAAAVAVTLVTYAVRAWRWQILLAPIGRTRFRTAFRTTVIGFAASFLLPGRVGELLRPYLLARREGLSATSTFATIVVERLLDMTTILAFFGFALLTTGVVVDPDVRRAGVVAAAGSVVAVIVLIVLAGHPERMGRWTARVSSFLPGRMGHALAGFVRTFAEGLKVMRSPGHLAVALAWSLPLWLSLTLGIWLTSQAFGLTFSFPATFLVLGLLAIGVATPTPGATGGFHWAYLYAVTFFFGADRDTAGAAAIVLHAVSFVPVTLVGLLFMWQDGLTLGRLRGLKAEARAESAAAAGPEPGG